MKPSKHNLGVSIVELLVVMAIFGILSGLIVNFFVSQQKAAAIQKAANEANEAVRTALSLITWDIQNAGYRVSITDTNPAFYTSPLNSDDAQTHDYTDLVTTLYRDDNVSPAVERRVRYSIGGSPVSLRRAEYTADVDPTDDALADQPSVASIVAMNIRYETREDQFWVPTGSGSATTCDTGSTPIPQGAVGSAIVNCSVDWVEADTPERLVRQVKLQLLARSENKIPGYSSSIGTVEFEGTTATYQTEPGYIYRFAEQTIVVPNLGR